MNKDYFRKENEDELDYCMRLVSKKKEEKVDDLDWQDIVDLLGLNLNKDSLRKATDTDFGGLSVYNKMKERQIKNETVNYQEEVQIQLQELKKERMKIADERASLNRRLRESSREESLSEIAKECASKIEEKFPLNIEINQNNKNNKKVALLTLSDLHYGLNIDEFNNKYNSEICKERLNKLTLKIIEVIELQKIENMYILGCGDYISGLLHNIIRLESRENVIEQVIGISELLAQFINELSKYCYIKYYDVSDNHGRIFSNKDDTLNKDNFSMLIKWYLKSRFINMPKIEINDNEINENIGTIEIFNRNYAFTHGHHDKIDTITQNLSLMTKKFYDAIFIAHCHHLETTEVHGTYVYMNGTFAGTDEYSNNLRKTSRPSQNLYVISKDEGIECQYTIKL